MKSIKKLYSKKSQNDFEWYDTKNGKKEVKRLSHKRVRKSEVYSEKEAANPIELDK